MIQATVKEYQLGLHLTVGDSLAGSVRKYPDKTAIVFEDRHFTYREFNERVNRVSHLLMSLGLKKGDRVAVLAMNCNEIVEVLMALGKCGLVAVPVNFRFAGREIEFVVSQPGCGTLFVAGEFMDAIAEVRDRLTTVEHCIAFSPEPLAGMGNYEALLAANPATEPTVAVADDDPWFIGFTSGTTGFPKGAVLTHGARMMPVLNMAIEYGIADTDVVMVTMPIFHSNGLTFTHMGLALGNTVVILRQFDPEGVLRAVDAHGISYASMVPTMYSRIVGLPPDTRARYDLTSMRVLISSSAPLMTQTKEDILQFFPAAQLNEFYGSTEAGIVTNLKPRDQMRKVRCVGQPIFGVQVKVVDPEGNEVAPGEVGELYSLGPCCQHYFGLPEATQRAFSDGWFTAGDLARVDEEGYIYIVDRRTDLIISGGENIYPAEVEDLLMRMPGVRELAVIGIPHPDWGETVHLVLVPESTAVIGLADVESFCQGRLAKYKRPRSMEVVDALPKTQTGKILRRVLKEERRDRTAKKGDPVDSAVSPVTVA